MTKKEELFTTALAGTYIAYVLFRVAAFSIISEHSTNFWIGFLFSAVAWHGLIILEAVSFTGIRNCYSGYFLNMPGMVVSVIHLAIQLIIGLPMMLIPNYIITLSAAAESISLIIYFVIIASLRIYKIHVSGLRG